VLENGGPVFPGVPGDFAGRVNLDRHHLADASTLDDDDQRADPAVLTTPLLASLDISNDERVADVSARNDMSSRDGETSEIRSQIRTARGRKV
jgi:hypothetical protein